MKNLNVILDSSTFKTGSDIQLPVIIRLFQHDQDLLDGSASKGISELYKARNNTAGGLESGYMDFTMDFTCAPIIPYDGKTEENKGKDIFWYINGILNNKKNPTFTKKYFLENYYVIEVPDYGHQSMSYGYRDFVPHVYYNGRKIWQKYIGIIRQYSKKLMWIVIKCETTVTDKITNYTKFGNVTVDQPILPNAIPGNFIIRMVAKNNIEKSKRFLLDNEDKGSLDYPVAKAIDAFDYYTTDSKILQNANAFYNVTADPYTNTVLGQQNITVDNQKKEYFRQSFVNDYGNEKDNINETLDPGAYNRPENYAIYKYNGKDEPPYGKRVSRQNYYNAEYIPFIKNDIDKCLKNYYNPTFYDEDGYMVYLDDSGYTENSSATLEVVPEYTSTRKFEWELIEDIEASPSQETINKVLYENHIFPYNTINQETLHFIKDKDGKYIFGGSGLKNATYCIIYDNGEDGGAISISPEKKYKYTDADIQYRTHTNINKSNPFAYTQNAANINSMLLGSECSDDVSKMNNVIYFTDNTTNSLNSSLNLYDDELVLNKVTNGDNEYEYFISTKDKVRTKTTVDGEEKELSFKDISDRYQTIVNFLDDNKTTIFDTGEDDRKYLVDLADAISDSLDFTDPTDSNRSTDIEPDTPISIKTSDILRFVVNKKIDDRARLVYFRDNDNRIIFTTVAYKYLFCKDIDLTNVSSIITKQIGS